MNKLAKLLIMCLLLGACRAEAPAPAADEIASGASELIGILCACPSFESFDGAPGAELAREAVSAYLLTLVEGEETEARAYSQLFAYGEWIEGDHNMAESKAPPARAFVESALDSGAGEVIANVYVEYDYGYGWEFGCYFDAYLVPDPGARYGARVAKIFIPE